MAHNKFRSVVKYSATKMASTDYAVKMANSKLFCSQNGPYKMFTSQNGTNLIFPDF